MPAALAAPPHPMNASIRSAAVVFALLLVVTITSRYPCKSSIPTPMALMESVTWSLVVARSACVASASLSTGVKAAVLSSTFHPASAIYPKASAASEAVKVVALPASLAAADSFA